MESGYKKVYIINPKKKMDISYKKSNIENCIFNNYFYYFWKNVIGIKFTFWNLISVCVTKRINEKNNTLFKIIENSKNIWKKRNFNQKNTFILNFEIISKVSRIITYYFHQFLQLHGPIFLTKFFKNFNLVLGRIYTTNFHKKLKKIGYFFTKFTNNDLKKNYHMLNQIVFVQLSSSSIIISSIWLKSKLLKCLNFPWWRLIKIRECELEYNCKVIINSICGNFQEDYI